LTDGAAREIEHEAPGRKDAGRVPAKQQCGS